jgi:site-specific DNA recombinase
MTAAKPWIAYARVSTDEQGSLDAQLDGCRSMLRVMGIAAAQEVVDDGFTGSNLDRPGAQRVMAAVDQGAVAGVVVWKLDRMTRSLRDLLDLLERFERAGVALASVQERLDTSTPMGRMVVHILGVFAQFEREVIAERVKMGMRHLAAAGFFTGARVPPGCLVEGPPRQRVLKPDPATAPAVTQAWTRLADGQSLKQVAAYLAEVTGQRQMSASGARKLLLNERMIGLLVDRGTFEKARAAMAARFSPRRGTGTQHATQHPSDREWPLRGILRCTACGALMVGVTVRNGSGTPYPYLRCGERARRGRAACAAKDMPAEPTEAAVIEALVRAIVKDQAILPALAAAEAATAPRADAARDARAAAALRRDAAAQRVGNLVDAIAEGGDVARAIRPRLAAAQSDLDALDRALATLDGELAAYERGAGSAARIAELFAGAADGLLEAPLEEQVPVVRALVRSARLVPPDGIDLELNLPNGDAPGGIPGAFVGHWPMVERGPLPTVLVRTSARARSLREWNDRGLESRPRPARLTPGA